MSSNSGNNDAYGFFGIIILIASQLDRLGFLGGSEHALAENDVSHHHSHEVALASPSPSIPIPPESTSWLPEGVIWVLGIALVIVVIWIIYAILTEIQKETEERCLVLERKLKVQQTWIDEHEWMESRLSKLSDEIRQDRAQIQSHQKMLKILKHMPSFQVHAATLTVSAAVANPKAAHEIREQMKHSAQTSSVWEKESEVNDGR